MQDSPAWFVWELLSCLPNSEQVLPGRGIPIYPLAENFRNLALQGNQLSEIQIPTLT
jgi:hypothetical protein